MNLNGNTKLADLLEKHPFLLDYLVHRAPAFKKLENPVLRKTVGKVATLSQVAAKAGIAEEVLVEEIAGKIAAQAA
ncbi:DUF1858 domain-containing protein [Geomonas sp. RF6]|uniref:DUF1858 domain-containing protein n=1 Tax=Geomonas sp. RF6 TaxID=2897342 RepID=UPI001E2A39A7|nr:DUF1858 domain-containing protein [Geomonas sp. RF6]UFS72531.1 DUF1858 domain-containing protein [Geomonas sp. RF6]